MTTVTRTAYQCQALDRKVTLTRQTHFNVSGLSDSSALEQHDFGCSKEQACQYRYTDACEVQLRNR